MKKPFSDAYNVLKVMGVPVFANADNDKHGIFIDGEARSSDLWINYHFPPPHWEFGVHPAVEDVLRSFGLMCEWVNPSLLGVYEA
jgi:hypothetical protein